MQQKSILIFSILSFFFINCSSSKKAVKKKTSKKVVAKSIPKKLPSVKEDKHINMLKKKKKKLNKYTLQYIKKYAPIAIREMHTYKIPASITLAQGILESGNGRSRLALKSNNHFGIKCHASWRGEKTYHDDDKKGECFRKYKYVATSYKDHSLFLKNRKRYRFLFNLRKNDYKGWAKGLKKAGYATDRKYPSKLLLIIEKYKLYAFDKFKKNNSKSIENEAKETPVKLTTISNYYKVTKGDTLYSIAKKFKITVVKLKKTNKLQDNTIHVGQHLFIK